MSWLLKKNAILYPVSQAVVDKVSRFKPKSNNWKKKKENFHIDLVIEDGFKTWAILALPNLTPKCHNIQKLDHEHIQSLVTFSHNYLCKPIKFSTN